MAEVSFDRTVGLRWTQGRLTGLRGPSGLAQPVVAAAAFRQARDPELCARLVLDTIATTKETR